MQPTFALVRVVRGDYLMDIKGFKECMLGFLTSSEAYEFGQLGAGLSWCR